MKKTLLSCACLAILLLAGGAQAQTVTPPYSEAFATGDFADTYTILDVNGDGTRWSPYLGSAQISFNTELAMDDWLITPPLALEGGKMYSFSIEVMTGNASTEETFEVMYGAAPEPEALTAAIVPRTQAAHTEYRAYTGTLSPAESGTYYVGIHGCSAADTYSISVKNLEIGAATGSTAPAAPTALAAATRTNGELKADISLAAPTHDLAGNPLKALQEVRLLRDGAAIHTFEAPAPGAALQYVDEVPECSRYTYSAIAVNDGGESPAAEVKAFVGVLEPADPAGITLTETGTPGEVTLAWEPVAADIRGNALDAAYVTYRIYGGEGQATLLHSGLTETSKTFQAVDGTAAQAFVQYCVVAETRGGISNFAYSPLLAVGPAYPAPFAESFAGGKAATIVGTFPEDLAAWRTFTTEESGLEAQDGDGGFIGSEASYLGDYGTFLTGKIDLAGLESPALAFYVYHIPESEGEANTNELEVAVACGGETAVACTVRSAELPAEEGWLEVAVPLDEWRGRVVQLAFTSRHALLPYIFVDNIRVSDAGGAGLLAPSAGEALRTEYYSVGGLRLAAPQPGVVIVRTVYKDGRAETAKAFVR